MAQATMKTLALFDEVGSKNNLTILRLIAALSVIWGHSFAVVFDAAGKDPVSGFIQAAYIGDIAVYFFFIISGFLVAGSLERRGGIEFVAARVLRIFPGLIVCNIVMIAYVAFAYHGGEIQAFLSSGEVHRFFVQNSLLYPVPVFELPNSFPHNLIPNQLAGTYWTLPAELRCYIVLFILGLLGFHFGDRQSRSSRGIAVCLLAALIAASLFTFSSIPIIGFHPKFARLFIFFLMGVLFHLLRDYVPIRRDVALLAAIALIVTRAYVPGFEAVSYVSLPLIVFYLAFGVPYSRLLNEHGDFSYGVYIYGWMSQQIVASANPHQSPYLNFAGGALLALGFAAVSWFLVENPALRFKSRLFDRRRPIRDRETLVTPPVASTMTSTPP